VSASFAPGPPVHPRRDTLSDGDSPPPGACRLMVQAEQISQDRAELGEEVTRKLLTKCQANVRALCLVEAQQQACRSSLGTLTTPRYPVPPPPASPPSPDPPPPHATHHAARHAPTLHSRCTPARHPACTLPAPCLQPRLHPACTPRCACTLLAPCLHPRRRTGAA